MRKFLTLCAIALVALFSCSKPNEQIPEETIQYLSEAQSILPDEIQVTSDGAPATKAGVIDAEDAKVLGNENLLKFYWDNDDEIDIFGYDGEYIRSLLYKVTNVDETNVYSRFEVKIRKQNSWPISGMIDLIANDDISVVNPAFVAIYPHGLVSEDYGESYYNGAWTAPTNENPTHYVKMKLPSSYELDPTSRGGDNYINVRGMRLQSPMLGLYRLDGGITFYHLAGVLKIDFTGIADGVKYFKVNAPGKKISGEYNVPINAKTSPRPYIALADTDVAAEQTIEFTYGSALNSGAENGTENHVLYIPLPVGTYDQGITVDVYNGDNVLVGQWGVSSLTIGRGALKYTSSFAVERIIEPDSNSNVICVAPMVSITGSNPTKGVAVNFADQSLEDVELTYGDYPQYYPRHVYIAGNSNTSVGVVSGNLNHSTVDLLGGNYAGCEMTTAANTLNIRKGANVGTINIKGGNAKVSGGYQNIIVDENATADGVSAPVNVTITSTATAMSATTPTVTINAPTNLVIAKPVDSDKEDITVINVVVAATDANTTGTAVSNLTVGENVNVHFVAATGTDVNVETVVATDDDDANGAVTYDGVAQIGSTTYASLAAAIAAVPTDGTKTTIQMIADETMETGTALTIAANQNIVLDLNGKTVTGNGGLNGATFHLITNKGTLEITDSSAGQNGKLTGYWTSPDTGYSNEFNTIYNLGGTLTLSAGTVETTSSYLSYAINNSSNAWGIGDDKETVFIMTGGTINSPSGDAGLRVYQNCAQNATPFSHNTVTISGGTIATGGIFLDNYIYNPNANTTGSGILTTVTISGGEIHGLIDMKMRHAFNTTFNTTGGTFVDSKLWVRKHSEWNSVVAEPTAPVFFISGGNFTFVQNKAFGLAYDCSGTSWTSYTQPYSITGGTFNVDPATFVAAGYEAYQDGSVWRIREAQGVAKIGTTSYASLAAAVAAAQSGDIIELIADDDISLTNGGEIEINKSLTITGATDAQGNPLYTVFGKSTVTGTNDIFITGSGEVTLSNLKIKNFGNNASTNPGHAPIYVSTNFTGNINLSKVYVSDFNRGGIFLYGGEFNVDDCYIDCANPRSGAFTKGIEIKGSAHGTISDTFICNMERSSTTYSCAGIEIYGYGSVEVDSCTIISDNDTHQTANGTFGIVISKVGEHDPSGGSTQLNECLFDCTNGCLSVEESSSVTVNNCSFENYIATWSANSNITINGGTFTKDVYADKGTIIINDGEFSNFLPDTNGGSIIIYGGVFDADPSTYVAEGYAAVEEDGWWTVSEIQGVAQIGSTRYASLAAAIAAVPTDGTKTTIQMIANETMAENTVIEIAATKNIVLDLNGKTISSIGGSTTASYYFIQNRGTLEINDFSSAKNGKITSACTIPSPGYSKEYVTVYNIGGTLTLAAGTVETTSGGLSYAINNSSNAWGINDNKETVFTMTGGTINAPSGDAALRVYQNCADTTTPFSHNTVTISGGTIASGGIFLDNYIYKPNENTTGAGINTNVTITGGEIHGLIDLKLRHAFHTTFTISGGTFVDSKLWVRKHSEWNSVVAEPTEPIFIINGKCNFTFVDHKAFGLAYDCDGTSWTSYTRPYSILAGSFNENPSAFVPTEGYAVTQEDGVYIVGITDSQGGGSGSVGGDSGLDD